MGASAIDTTYHKTNEWIHQICREMNTDNENFAYSALRSVLHALRDRMVVDEAAQLGAQLPMLIRGLYYDGWNPSKVPTTERSRQDFLDRIQRELGNYPGAYGERAAQAVFAVLRDRISPGEIQDVMAALPQEIRALWPERVGT